MAFYSIKGKTEGVFKIQNTNGKDSYSVWDNNNKRFLRDGNMTDSEGNEHNVQDTKFIKRDDFIKLFPHMNKNNKVRWEVIVDGEVLTWEAPRSVDQGLSGCIANVIAMGQNPQLVEYKWSKTGQGLQTRYTVVLAGGESTPADAPNIIGGEEIIIPSEKIEISETEKQVVNAIKQQGQSFGFEQLKDTFLKYDISEERAKKIYEQELK